MGVTTLNAEALRTLIELAKNAQNSIGYFLQNYVVVGGAVTKDTVKNNQVNVTQIVVSLSSKVSQHGAISFTTVTASTTYYLDYQADDLVWATAHPIGTYQPVASVTTDVNGNVNIITDTRGTVGGFKVSGEIINSSGDSLAIVADDIIAHKTDITAHGYTASDVLTKIKTVDGAGSGLDADTVKGYTPVNKAGDTITGNLTIGGNLSLSSPISQLNGKNITITAVTGSPEGVVTANVGSLAVRDDGGVSTTLYVKQSGIGNTGWVAK